MNNLDSELPSDIEEAARKAVLTLIPEKSKSLYDTAYEKFEIWLKSKKVKHISEKVMLAYFEEKRYLKSSTLWSLYSMLRAELSLKKGIDIKGYYSLIAYLKRCSDGYKAKKSNVFTRENMSKFLKEADDSKWLLAKVVLIVGVAGACRKVELTFLRNEDVIDEHSHFRVNIPITKTKTSREFVITEGGIEGISFVDILRRYINMRPKNLKHNRFFIKYLHGKCSIQPVGINSIGQLPKKIAELLGLKNPELFTGHCFRRSSATFLADSGANLLKIKQHGGWKSNSVAEGYVENSIENKKSISASILGETSSAKSLAVTTNSSNSKTNSGINLSNCTNCVINIYNN